MKNKLKRIGYLLLVPLVVFTMLFFPAQQSEAANLTAAYLVLNRMKVNLTTGDLVEMYVGLATTGAIGAGSTIKLEFPVGTSEVGKWCGTAGALAVSGIATTPADLTSGNYDIDAALPGTLSAICTIGSGGVGDSITITGATALTAGTTYGFKLSNNTGKLGTPTTAGTKIISLTVTQGTTVETMAFGVNIVNDDQVVISAQVIDVQTVTCTVGANTVNLGNLYKGGIAVTGGHNIGTTTSGSANGYYWTVYGRGNGTSTAGLWKSVATTYLIASNNGSPTVNISGTGSEGFGLNLTSIPSGTNAGTGFYGNSAGVYGSVAYSAANAELLLYRTTPAGTTEYATVEYGARAGSGAQAGAYSETITYVCGGYY